MTTRFLTSFFILLVLLIGRIWHVDQQAARQRGDRQTQLRPVLHILVDAGAIYSFTLVAALICFASQSNVQYVILSMVSPSYLAS